jgi:hypothetical protein
VTDGHSMRIGLVTGASCGIGDGMTALAVRVADIGAAGVVGAGLTGAAGVAGAAAAAAWSPHWHGQQQ